MLQRRITSAMSVRVNTHMSQIDLHHVPILETHWQLIGKLQYTVWNVSFFFFKSIYIPGYKPETKTGRS